MDANDNELAYLEAIHFFVEVLDQFFGNVCELDLVFNFYKVGCRFTLFLAGSGRGKKKRMLWLTRFLARSMPFSTRSFLLVKSRKPASRLF